MNARRWIVHIGAPKTGSTAIQRCLSDNRRLLTAQGVLYPDVSLRGWGHHDLAFLLDGGYPAWATPQTQSLAALCAALQAAVAASAASRIVLSSENFYIYPQPAALRRLLQSAGMGSADSVSIVCYVRRQDEAQMSWYNQMVKAQGYSGSFESSLRLHHGLWDYAARLRVWQAEFGTQALQLRPYELANQSDVCADFLELIGVPISGLHMPAGRANERINRDILHLQRLVNRLPLKVTSKRRYHKQLIALTAAAAQDGIFDDQPHLASQAAWQLMQSYAEGNAWLAQTFLGRDTLFAVSLPDSQPDNPVGAPRGWTMSKLRYTLHWILGQRASCQRRPDLNG